jgi:hypothetical protein
MAIVLNKFTVESNTLFKSHEPFNIPPGTFATNRISEMVSVNYVTPVLPVKINQIYGASTAINFDILIKNLTINVPMEIEIRHTDFFIISTARKFIVAPRQERQISVTGNNTFINGITTQPINRDNFKVLIKNTTQDIAYIPTNVTRYTPIEFPFELTVD